jgi:polar amino acid transport system ATP-binding protein
VNAPTVVVNDVHKSFGATEVLKGVNLEIERGHVQCLIGASGSGKSTLLRCINHLETLSRGYITVNGQLVGYDVRGGRLHEVGHKTLAQRRSKIGMVFQQFNLFGHLTAAENVAMAPVRVRRMSRSVAMERALALLDQVGLKARCDAYPAQLSGGQQQRVAIARALAMEPDVMLFDEPTSALDPELVGEVLDSMRELADGGMTMVVVTHEIAFAREVGTNLAFMHEGQIVEQGDPRAVTTNPSHERTQSFLAKVLL